MRVVKARASGFKRDVTRRAFKTKRNPGRHPATIFEARRQIRTSPYGIGNVKRHRGFANFAVIPISLGFNLGAFMAGKRNAVVFEIGCGGGNFLADMRKRYRENVGKTVGLDLANHVWPEAKKGIDELHVGDALVARFPKSDLIVSQWAPGYIRDPNFLLKKIENALKQGGVALIHFDQQDALHFNVTIGKSKAGNFYIPCGRTEANFDKLFERLAKRGKIGDSKVKIVRPDPVLIDKLQPDKLPPEIQSLFPPKTRQYIISERLAAWKSRLKDMKKDPLILIQKPERK